MKIGVLTGGGDCPGLNAVIRAVVRKGNFHYGDEFLGFMEGWRGLLEDKTMPLDLETVGGILPRGGTILGSSRTNPYKRDDGVDRVRATLSDFRIDGLKRRGELRPRNIRSLKEMRPGWAEELTPPGKLGPKTTRVNGRPRKRK